MPENKSTASPPGKKTDSQAQHPAIRTMGSDIQDLLKTSRPTISQMITKEPSPAARMPPAAPRSKQSMKGVLFLIFGILLIAGIIGGGIWYFLPATGSPAAPGTPSGNSPPPVLHTPPPPPLFSVDASRTITIPENNLTLFLKLVTDTLQEPEKEKVVKRIPIQIQKNGAEHYATLAEFFALWHITPPENFLQHLDPAFMFFIYYGSDGPRIGFAAKTRDNNRTLSDIFFWEHALISDFTPFFFQEQIKTPDTPLFEDRTSLNTDWRYIKLSTQKDLGIGYMVFQANHLVIFTTSKTSMEGIIKTLYGTQ